MNTSAQILELTGGRHARFAWIHRTGLTTADVLVFDTGSGETRTVAAGIKYDYFDGFTNPYISPDGQWVVFGDGDAAFKIPFAGGSPQKVTDQAPGGVWRDPETGSGWLLTKPGEKETRTTVYRCRLGDPATRYPVTDLAGGWQVSLSADGTRAGAALQVKSSCGRINLAENTDLQTGSGCWPAIAPDNSYRVFNFMMPHNRLTVAEADGTSRVVACTPNGHDVYHPRWSSDVRFMTADTREGAHGDPQGYGMQKKEEWFRENGVFLGKFSPDYSGFDSWVRVSDFNGNCNAYAWIDPENST
jgi:hypothetical protein